LNARRSETWGLIGVLQSVGIPHQEKTVSEQVVADSDLRAKLAAANGQGIKLCDEAGKVIGYALTPEQLRRYEIEYAKSRLSEQDIERILSAPGGYSMEDVLALVERQ
jgi:hypothetical protein